MSSVRLSSHERRAAILHAAVRLFSEKGFKGTTTRELAAIVGVSEPILYQHFTTKRDLYNAIIEDLADSGPGAIAEHIPLPGPDFSDDRTFLIQLATDIIQWHVDHPEFVRLLMLSALEKHEFNELFYERYATAFCDRLSTYFAARMRAGVFRTVDPALPVQSFSWLIAHYSMELTLFRKCHLTPQHQTIEGIIDLFLKGLEA